MHLDPDEDLKRTVRDADATQAWPRQRAVDRQDGNDRTRLALEGLAHVAEPTVVTPAAPPPKAVRTGPAPAVKPIPAAVRSRAAHPAGKPAPREVVEHIAQVLDTGEGFAARIRRIGPGGILGWRPLGGPTVHEVAEARRKVAEAEERRRFRHQQRLDALEIFRAWLKVAILFGLLALVVGAGVVAFLILSGHYAWAPTAVD